MIDERAFAKAWETMKAHFEHEDLDSSVLQAAIETYEAALWRPIEEATRDGVEIQVAIPERAAHLPQYNAIMRWDPASEVWHERYHRHGGWQHSYLQKEGAMFRTVDPLPAAKP